MAPDYARLSQDRSEGIRLDDVSTPSRRSASISDDSEISYRDNLEDEPFQDEKDRRFNQEGLMEDGEGYSVEPRRVRRRSLIW